MSVGSMQFNITKMTSGGKSRRGNVRDMVKEQESQMIEARVQEAIYQNFATCNTMVFIYSAETQTICMIHDMASS
jgi:hypothetical protein